MGWLDTMKLSAASTDPSEYGAGARAAKLLERERITFRYFTDIFEDRRDVILLPNSVKLDLLSVLCCFFSSSDWESISSGLQMLILHRQVCKESQKQTLLYI